jgi:hypothetical protein
MGLDIYFHKTKRTEWERFQNDTQAKSGNSSHDFEPEEIGYFRKVNFLMSFFDYDGNCEYKEISRERLQALRDACAEIAKMKPVRIEITRYDYGGTDEVKDYSLADKTRCAELLPTQSGFFFGNTEYDQWYFQEVKEVLIWVDRVLSDLADDEVVLMYCWW